MRNIRAGKDIKATWQILTNGEVVDLAGRDLTLHLIHMNDAPYPIDFSTEGNNVIFTLRGTEVNALGVYRLSLWENKDKKNQTVVDHCDAFRLVSTTCKETDETNNNLTLVTLDLGTANLELFTFGSSDFEDAPSDGNLYGRKNGQWSKVNLDGKVDKEEGKSLISDTEIERLSNVDNYDDTEIKQAISSLNENKANKDEIPSLEGLATEEWVNQQGYLTEHQDISGLATKEELANKQDALKSGENIKTINGESILGEGNIEITGSGEATSENVTFTTDLTITADVGVHTVGSSGSKTLETRGKSLKQVMDMLFAEEKNPNVTQPSVSLASSSMGAKEVGTMVTPNYNASLNPGSYQYGPATGVIATSWEVTDNAGHSSDLASGTFPEFQVEDSSNYSLSATAQHTEGAIPKTNLGNDYAAGKIAAGSKKATKGNITGYRNSFYGTFANKDSMNSASIRTLTKSNKALANGNTFNVSIPVGALRVAIAYPATLRNLTSVLDVNGLNANITSAFKMETISVEGANGYSAIEYKVYYLDYANPNNKANTYKVTI